MKNTFSRNPNDTHDLLKVRMSQALHCTPQCTKEREGIPSSGSCPRRAGHRRSRSARVISLVPTSATPFPHKTSILQPSRLPVVDEDDMWPRPAPLFSNSSFKTRMKERENAAGSLGSVQVYMRSRVRGGCSMNATYRFPDSAGQGSWVNLPVGYRRFQPFFFSQILLFFFLFFSSLYMY